MVPSGDCISSSVLPDHFKGASYGPEYSALLMTLKVHKSKDGCSYKHHSCGYWKPKLYPVETAFLAVFTGLALVYFVPGVLLMYCYFMKLSYSKLKDGC